jgi:hypothetical protein
MDMRLLIAVVVLVIVLVYIAARVEEPWRMVILGVAACGVLLFLLKLLGLY